ncbi:MAG: hypothetical protein LBE12_03805 [Planctomycetaceae bacterium]|jgi:hypothetical protein|nr:hypothetical protein [Planctomycetaceae bacterium]
MHCVSTNHKPNALKRQREDVGVPTPAVALRLTAGYAVYSPSGVKSEKQKFHR